MREDPTEERADALAHVCAHLEEIREDLREGPGGSDAPLERLLSRLRDGGEVTECLEALHAALQAGGDALGVHRSAARGLEAAGIRRDVPVEVLYLCPSGRCSRHAWPDRTGEVPVCAVDGRPLRDERL